MRIVPRSLYGRLLGISAVTTVIALLFAAWSIAHVLERFVVRGLDAQLDAEVAMLARAVRDDGTLDRARIVDLPAFDAGEPGWGWRVDSRAEHWTGGDAPAAPPIAGRKPDARRLPGDGPRPGETWSAGGMAVHSRALTLEVASGAVTLAANGPAHVARRPLREAMAPLLLSLLLLGTALAAATLLQLRLGLQPLRRLATSLAAVRAGTAQHIPTNQPAEIAPLAAELNALIDQNAARLDHARRHVANLAHGLKTPLAALAVGLAEDGRDPDGVLGAKIAAIDRQVRHHLSRARAAAPGGAARQRVAIGHAVEALIAALARIHADRPVGSEQAIDHGLMVAVDPQDLDEMLGNLLDNAWRHARSRVRVAADTLADAIRICIDDDGRGMGEAAYADALVPGRRLDERGEGHGFGLSIAAELAELNGGTLTLERAPALGGLRVVLALPQ